MMSQPDFPRHTFSDEIDALCSTAHWCAARGWVPATSGNFSVREGAHIFVTATGLDKGALTSDDLLEIDTEGRVLSGRGRPSAETDLHTVIYHARPQARAILHVHSIWNTLISARFAAIGYVPIEGYELLKGLSDVKTHMHLERIPVIENSQNYVELSAAMAGALETHPQAHGVLLSRHGLYTWGQSVAEARRHLEALEFLFEVEERRLSARGVEVTPDVLD